jgi:hypothetical protein
MVTVPATAHVHAAAVMHAAAMPTMPAAVATTMATAVAASMPAAVRGKDRRRDEQARRHRRSEGEFAQHWGFLVVLLKCPNKSSSADEPRLNTRSLLRDVRIRGASRSAARWRSSLRTVGGRPQMLEQSHAARH